MSQDFLSIDELIANSTPIEEQIINSGSVSPYIQKLINTTRTLEEKQNLVKNRVLEKALDLTGFQMGNVTGSQDADTFDILDAYGNKINGRIASANTPFIDAVEVQHGTNMPMDAVAANAYKLAIQPDLVSQMVGKPIEQLTDEDYENVGRYQQNTILSQLRGNTSNPAFDSATTYTNSFQEGEQIPVMYRVTGTDKYGRSLVELVNPDTQQQVTFDYGNNPYLNANFNVYNSIASDKNYQKMLEGSEFKKIVLDNIQDLNDSDGRISEAIDIAQSAGYQSAARFLNLFRSDEPGEGFINWWDTKRKLAGKATWAEMSDPELGQAVADGWAGVKRSTRQDYIKEMGKAEKLWSDGDYLGSLWAATKQLDRILAESSVQMGLMVGGAAITGGAGGILAGAALAAFDATLMDSNEYKMNNNGKEFTSEQYAQDYIFNLLTLIPEVLLVKTGFTKFLAKPFQNVIKGIPDGNLATNALKSTLAGTAGETAQEYVQGVGQTYFTQDQKNKKSVLEIATSPDATFQGAVGGLAGGALSGVGGSIPAVASIPASITSKTIKERIKNYDSKHTFTGNQVNETNSEKVQKDLKAINPENITSKNIKETLDTLTNLGRTKDMSIDTHNQVETKKAEVITEALNSSDESVVNAAKEYISNAQETVEKVIYYSDPKSQLEREQIETVAEKLNIPKDEIETLNKDVVDLDARYGRNGYVTNNEQIEAINNRLKNDKSLTEEEIDNLKASKAYLLGKTQRLYNNQVGKVDAFSQAVDKLAKNPTLKTVTTKFPSGKTFTLTRKDLINNSFESNKGVYSVISSTMEDVRNMDKMIISNKLKSNIEAANKALNHFINVSDQLKTISDKAFETKFNGKGETTPKELMLIEVRNVTEKYNKDNKNITNYKKILNKYGSKKIEKVISEFKSMNDPELDSVIKTLENSIKERADRAERQAKASEKVEVTPKPSMVENTTNKLAKATTKIGKTFSALKRYFITPNLEELIQRENELKEESKITTLSPSQEKELNLITKQKEILQKRDTLNKLIEKREQAIERIDTLKKDVASDVKYLRKLKDELIQAKVNKKSKIDINTIREELEHISDNIRTNQREITKLYKSDIFNVEKRIIDSSNIFNGSNTMVVMSNGMQPAKNSKTPINLYDTVKISTRPSTLLSEFPIQHGAFTRKIVNEFKNSLDFPMSNGKLNINKLRLQRGSESPAYALLLDNKGNVNDNVAMAIDFSTREFFLQANTLLSPKTNKEVDSAFGENARGNEDNIYSIIGDYGVPRSTIANMIGEKVLNSLGLEVNKETSTEQDYRNLESNLGNIALTYAESMGWITDTVLSKDNPITIYDNDVHMVRYTASSTAQMNIKAAYDRLESIKLDNITSKVPLPYKPKLEDTYSVRKTKELIKASKPATEALNKLKSTKHVLNTELAEFVAKNKQFTLEALGWIDPKNVVINKDESNLGEVQYSRKEQESILGSNRAIEQQINDFIDLYNSGNTDWYFEWFLSRNGRYNMDSTTVNPQTGKDLARFLLMPENTQSTLSISNATDMEYFIYTLAEAFDVMDTDSKMEAKIQKLLDTPNITKGLRESFLADPTGKKLKDDYGLGIENFGQVLVAFQAIDAYQVAKAENVDTFKTFLAPEHDSTTSGYFIKILQYPAEDTKKYMPKVGIISNDENKTEMHNLKKKKGFLDIYRTIASAFKLATLDITEKTASKELRNQPELSSVLFNAIQDALPKADGTINASLREIFKSPTMTFGYSMGEAAIKAYMGNFITERITNMYMEIQSGTFTKEQLNSPEYKAVQAMFNEILKVFPKDRSLTNELKTKFLSEIKFMNNDKVVNLGTLLNDLFADTYGKGVWDALKNEFSSFLKFNTYLNNAFVAMFNMFEKEYNKKVKEESAKGKVTIAKEEEIVNSLLNVFPIVQLIYSSSLNEGMGIIDNKRVSLDESTATQVHYNINNPAFSSKDSKSVQTVSNVRKFVAAVNSGAVIPIHYLDGTVMTLLTNQSKNKFLPIHDAIATSMNDGLQNVQNYNRLSYEVNKDYNLFGEVFNRLGEIAQFTDNQYLDDMIIISDPHGAISQYAKEYDEKSKVSRISIRNFLREMSFMNDNVTAARSTFYNGEGNNLYITNMDGVRNSGFETNRLAEMTDNAFKVLLEENDEIYRSDPKSYTTDRDLIRLNENSLTDMNTRVEIIDRLEAIDQVKTNPEHLAYLKGLLSGINSEYLSDIVTYLNSETATNNTGFLDGKGKKIVLNLFNEDTRTPVSLADKSGAEIYSHEILHAITDYVLDNADKLGKMKELNQLLNLQKQAMDVIAVEDLMPNNTLNSTEDFERANELWNYMFNNDDRKNLRGVKEFLAYGITNEKVMNKLKEHQVKMNKDNSSLLDRLINIAKSLLDVLSGETSIREAFKDNILRHDINMYESLKNLMDSLSTADRNATARLKYKNKGLEKIFGIVGNVANKGNALISPYIQNLITLADRRGYSIKDISHYDVEGSVWDTLKWYSQFFGLLLVSRKQRQMLPLVLEGLGLKYQGLIQSTLRDMNEPDYDSNMLEALSMKVRNTETASMSLEGTMVRNLLGDSGFGRELSEMESKALTKGVLNTDLSTLLSSYKMNEIIEMLSDEHTLNKEISILKDTIRDNEKFNWINNQAWYLARFMTSGVGIENLSLNARNIATKAMNGKTVSDKLVQRIDNLATLYALTMTPTETKEAIVALKGKGLDNYLKQHRNFVEESVNDGAVEQFHQVKGYSKHLFDPNIDIRIAPIADKQSMSERGYVLIESVAGSKITGRQGYGLYKNTYNVFRHRDGASFIISGANALGTSLQDIVADDMGIDRYDRNIIAKNRQEQYIRKADVIHNKLDTLMNENEILALEQIEDITDGFMPIINSEGNAVDYRITMSNKHKEKYLGQNLDGISILSKMYASKLRRMKGNDANSAVVDFLIRDMETNFIDTNLLGRNQKEYIKVEKNSIDKTIAEAWPVIPKEMKEYMFESNKDFYIRKDWINMLFGVQQLSAIDLPGIDKFTSNSMKRIITLVEAFIKNVAYMAKQNIVIRTPKVLIGNAISNINYSIMNGANPIQVFKLQLENAQNIRDYVDNRHALEDIEAKQKIGTASVAELNKINWYKTKMEKNPIHPLMEKGMYQSIVEDIAPKELAATGKIGRYIEKHINVPKPIKTIAKHLYMTEGTPIYDFMLRATQYSDFVARATEYKLKMDKAPTDPVARAEYEQQVSFDILNAFINYDKPSSAIEQYMNDMGLIMFTKFYKGIQHVIAKSFIEHPVSMLMFLATQGLIYDSEDITESNALTSSLGNRSYNIIDNITSAFIPTLVKGPLGIKY